MSKTVGKTKEVGFQFGLRRTFSISEEKAWNLMFSNTGLKIWLGDLKTNFSLKENYTTKGGIEGYVRIFKPYSHVRLNWKKKDWKNISTVQVRVMGKEKNKTLISFHQEKLLDSNQRNEMKAYWNNKMDEITEEIGKIS
ncbi:MAG: ATPase [Bacteroidota bacterium]